MRAWKIRNFWFSASIVSWLYTLKNFIVPLFHTAFPKSCLSNTPFTRCAVLHPLSVSSNLSTLSYTAAKGVCQSMSLGISVVGIDSLLFEIVVSISRTLLYDTPWPRLFIIFTNSAFSVTDLTVNGRRTHLVVKKQPLLTVCNMFWPTEFLRIAVVEKFT